MKTLKFIDIRRHLVSSLLELRVRPVGQPRSIVASCCVQTKLIFVQTSLKHTYSSKVTIGSVSSLSLSCTVGLLWHQGVGKLLAFMNFPTVELSLNACMFSNGGVKVTTCWFLQVKHISERWLETSMFCYIWRSWFVGKDISAAPHNFTFTRKLDLDIALCHIVFSIIFQWVVKRTDDIFVSHIGI